MILIYWIISTPLLPNVLIKDLEGNPKKLGNCIDSNLNLNYQVVVLGGGVKEYPKTEFEYELLNEQTLRRVFGVYELYKIKKPDAIIVSGGVGGKYKEAHLMRSLLIELGAEPELIKIEIESLNTHENIKNSIKILKLSDADNVIVITSAYHAARVYAVFNKKNFEVCMLPVDPLQVEQRMRYAFIPREKSFSILRKYLHEKIGYIYYKFIGYI